MNELKALQTIAELYLFPDNIENLLNYVLPICVVAFSKDVSSPVIACHKVVWLI